MCSNLTWRRRHLSTKRIPAELRPIALLGAGGCVRKPREMGLGGVVGESSHSRKTYEISEGVIL